MSSRDKETAIRLVREITTECVSIGRHVLKIPHPSEDEAPTLRAQIHAFEYV